MFKRYTLAIFLSLITSVSIAQTLGRMPGFITAMDRGPRNDQTLTNIFAQVANQPNVVVILDGGEWFIGTNVTVPTNVSLILSQNAWFNIRTNRTITFAGSLHADVHNIFRGEGRARIPTVPDYGGVGLYPFRIASWGITNHDIGIGYIQSWVTNYVQPLLNITNTFNTNFSYYYLDGTTQSLYGLTVRGPARFSNTVDIAGWLTTYGQTNHGMLETDYLQVNSGITVEASALTNLLYGARYAMESNRPFIGFSAISPTNRAQLMVRNAFTRITNITSELTDPQGNFAYDRYTPTNSGMYEFFGGVERYEDQAQEGDYDDWGALYLVRNNDTNTAGAFRTNSVILERHSQKSRTPGVYQGSAIMYANGSSDYFDLYYYTKTEAETNNSAMFGAHFLGK